MEYYIGKLKARNLKVTPRRLVILEIFLEDNIDLMTEEECGVFDEFEGYVFPENKTIKGYKIMENFIRLMVCLECLVS